MSRQHVLASLTQQAIGLLSAMLSLTLIFAAGALAGLAILTFLFKVGVAGGIDIVFYRGLILCGIAFVLTTLLLVYLGRATGYLGMRDAVAAGLMSLGLNLSFLVIVPVTLDRSNSVFILGYMAAHPGEAFTTQQIEAVFRDDYIDRLQQVARRMEEQRQSGNVVHSNNGYVITPQGQAFVDLSKQIAWLFGVDQRLLEDRSTTRAAR